MTVTRKSRTIIMTAADDAVTDRIYVTSISLVGTGMTTAHRLTITETDGAVLADHYVEATNENVELVNNEQWFDGLKISAAPSGGTWTVVIRYQ